MKNGENQIWRTVDKQMFAIAAEVVADAAIAAAREKCPGGTVEQIVFAAIEATLLFREDDGQKVERYMPESLSFAIVDEFRRRAISSSPGRVRTETERPKASLGICRRCELPIDADEPFRAFEAPVGFSGKKLCVYVHEKCY